MPRAKEMYLRSKGVDLERLHRKNAEYESFSNRLLSYHRGLSGQNLMHIYGVEQDPDCDCATQVDSDGQLVVCACRSDDIGDVLGFAEAIVYGIIDGVTNVFSVGCNSGLFGLVNSVFRIFEFYKIWIPSNIMKFNMSINGMFEAGNNVFAFCDVSHIEKEIKEYTEYKKWEQYVSLSGRLGGIFIGDFWYYKDCIDQGRAGQNGFDVGKCAGVITTLMVDTIL